MDQTVDGGDGHRLVGEDLVPTTKGLIGGNGYAGVFVAPGNQLEEHAGFGLVLVGIGDAIKDDQVEPVEFGKSGFKDEIAVGMVVTFAGPYFCRNNTRSASQCPNCLRCAITSGRNKMLSSGANFGGGRLRSR